MQNMDPELAAQLDEIRTLARPTECPKHVGDLRVERCAHRDGNAVVLRVTQDPDIFEVTSEHPSGGALTAPIDRERRMWAFEEFERRYLLGDSESIVPFLREAGHLS